MLGILENFKLAEEAESDLSPGGAAPPDRMSQAEADIRIFVHDFLWRDHDKDYRALAALLLPELRRVQLHIVRVDFWGEASVETLSGLDAHTRDGVHVWLLIWQGHMRLLLPPGPGATTTWRARASVIPAAGWRAHLEAGSNSPSNARKTYRCSPPPAGGAGGR